MKIVINTPTGHVGRVATSSLLDMGIRPILLVRHPDKVRHFAERGAVIQQGSLDDANFVRRGTHGADTLFWVTPSDPTAPDMRGMQNRLGRNAAAAINDNGIKRVVNLSSVGAHQGEGTGPVNGLHDVEKLLEEVCPNVTHLRPAFFFENYLWQLDNIRTSGSVYFPMSGTTRLPMIATRDIGRQAARRLADPDWKGRSIIGLHGPGDITFDEAALEIGVGLGREVRHIRITEDQARQALLAAGSSPGTVELMLEMYRAIESGHMRPAEPRTPDSTTSTTLEAFAREEMLPLLS